jgi:hypothetical protein
MRSLPAALAATVVAGALTGPPAGADPALQPTPEAVVASLPFQSWDEPNRVVVDLAREGDRPLVMMLDTGASVSVVTPLMARKLGVTVRRAKETPYRRATRLGRDLQFYVDTRSRTARRPAGSTPGGDFLDDYVPRSTSRRTALPRPEEVPVPERPTKRTSASSHSSSGTRVVAAELGAREVTPNGSLTTHFRLRAVGITSTC